MHPNERTSELPSDVTVVGIVCFFHAYAMLVLSALVFRFFRSFHRSQHNACSVFSQHINPTQWKIVICLSALPAITLVYTSTYFNFLSYCVAQRKHFSVLAFFELGCRCYFFPFHLPLFRSIWVLCFLLPNGSDEPLFASQFYFFFHILATSLV